MAVASFTQRPQAPEGTAQRVADRSNERLAGQSPPGGIYPAEGPTDKGGWWTFKVWASDEAYQEFDRTILQPALQDVGAPQADTRQLEVWWDSSQMPTGA
jgi:hypothetical protein